MRTSPVGNSRRGRRRMAGHSCALRSAPGFTMVELVVAMLIIALVMALAGPRVGRSQKALVREGTIARITGAFSQAGLRARGLGVVVELGLDPAASLLQIRDVAAAGGLPAPDTGAEQRKVSPLFAKFSRVQLDATKIEWHLGEAQLEEDQTLKYIFYPGGEASGQDIEATVAGQRYRLRVDRLTGRTQMLEIQD